MTAKLASHFIIAKIAALTMAILCAAIILAMTGAATHTPRHNAQPQPRSASIDTIAAAEYNAAVKCDYCDSCGELYPLDELVRIPYEKGDGGSICPLCADYWTMDC